MSERLYGCTPRPDVIAGGDEGRQHKYCECHCVCIYCGRHKYLASSTTTWEDEVTFTSKNALIVERDGVA